MTLIELCEPLFRAVCRLNQRADTDNHPDPAEVEADLEAVFSKMRAKAQSTPGLLEQYERVEMPLMFFVDNVISEGRLHFAADWPRLAYRRDERAGDQVFFHTLDEEMRDKSTPAAERLAIYYTCLGLGFTGWHAGDPATLTRYMKQLEPRVRQWSEADPGARITADAYAHTLTSDLTEPPARSLARVVIALVGMAIMLVAGNAYLYHSRTADLHKSLDVVTEWSKGAK